MRETIAILVYFLFFSTLWVALLVTESLWSFLMLFFFPALEVNSKEEDDSEL
jgi:hypothetical protein